MSENFSPIRWAIDISQILNAIPDYQRFPVDVASVAKEISRLKFPDDPITLVKGRSLPGFEGGMKKAPPGKIGWGIFYNTAIKSKGRINFTLGHEFGHYLLHRIDYPNGFMCSTEDMASWDSEYGRLESQANEFAANLLMPLDDFRVQVADRVAPKLDVIGDCADRYEVSLIAAILRWLSYTRRRSVLVVSTEGYVLWSRSSEAALRSRLYFKVNGRPPIPLPSRALAAQRQRIIGHKHDTEHDSDVWFNLPCSEEVLFSEQYDFTISLLHFEDANSPVWQQDADSEEDTFERFQRRTPGQGWLS